MNRLELIRFQADAELADSAARQCLAALTEPKDLENLPFCLALSGGRIAQRFFLPWPKKPGNVRLS
jgi:hypothetical protein